MNEHEKRIKQALVKNRQAILKKYRLLKQGQEFQEAAWERAFKPLSVPLKEVSELTKKVKKEEPGNIDSKFVTPIKSEASSVHQPSSLPQFLETEVVGEINSTDSNSDSEEQVSVSPNKTLAEQGISEIALDDYLSQFDPLPRTYLDFLIKDTKNEADTVYGIRFDPQTEKWYMGNKEVTINEKNFYVDSKPFIGTPGLYELLFKKHPLGFTEKDLQEYKEMLKWTNAHKRNFDPDKQLAGNKGEKYLKIIKPLFTSNIRPLLTFNPIRKKTGGTIINTVKEVNQKPVEYVYWNKPSELIERLKLLWASREAGHTGHLNEITSIIEELKEEGIIQ